MQRALLVAMALGVFSAPAHAVVYGGNPEITFKVDRAQHDFTTGDVDLTKVRMERCDGSWTDYTVNASPDPIVGYSLHFTAGDYCGATWYWSSVMLLDGSGQYGAFTQKYSNATTHVALTGSSQSFTLAPITWVNGVVYGGNPEFKVTVQ